MKVSGGRTAKALSGCLIFGLAAAALSPSVAQACSIWDVSGEWNFAQANGYTTSFKLQQAGAGIQGQARYGYQTGGDPVLGLFPTGTDPAFVDGSVDGSLNDTTFEITAYWNNNSIGVYSGKINPQGRLEGTTFDKLHPQNNTTWYSTRTAKCLDTSNSASTKTGPTVGIKEAPREGTILTAPPAVGMKEFPKGTVVTGPVASLPPPPSPLALPAKAAPSAGVNFTGVWDTVQNNGSVYALQLTQDASGNVTGAYSPNSGKVLHGVVIGTQLFGQWQQSGPSDGLFALAMAPDRKSFSGLWTSGNKEPTPVNADGSWDGTRKIASAPPPEITSIPDVPGQLLNTRVSRDTKVRRGAGKEFSSFATLKRGAVVARGKCTKGWCNVFWKGNQGWVFEENLGSVAAAGNTPPLSEVAPVELQAPTFAGNWTVSSDKPWGFSMAFNQNGRSVTGTYVIDVNGVRGRINGTVNGRVLSFNWDQDGGYTGDGSLRLSADGNSFDGGYRVDDNGTLSADLLQGKWHGTHQ